MAKITHTIIAFDRSGSMSGRGDEVVTAINEQLQTVRGAQERDPEGQYRVSIFSFSDQLEEHCWAADPKDLADASSSEYKAFGGTALNDMTGHLVERIEEDAKSLEGDDVSYLVCIITDGQESGASRKYRSENLLALKDRIKALEEKGMLCWVRRFSIWSNGAAIWVSRPLTASVSYNRAGDLLRGSRTLHRRTVDYYGARKSGVKGERLATLGLYSADGTTANSVTDLSAAENQVSETPVCETRGEVNANATSWMSRK